MTENLSLEVIVKDLASTVKSLQEEISRLIKKDREGTVDTPHWKNKYSCHDKDIGEVVPNFKIHHTCDGKSSEDDSMLSSAEGNTPRAYTVSTEDEAFLETTFGSKLHYTARRKQVYKIGAPDTKWVKTSMLPPVMASRKQWKRISAHSELKNFGWKLLCCWCSLLRDSSQRQAGSQDGCDDGPIHLAADGGCLSALVGKMPESHFKTA